MFCNSATSAETSGDTPALARSLPRIPPETDTVPPSAVPADAAMFAPVLVPPIVSAFDGMFANPPPVALPPDGTSIRGAVGASMLMAAEGRSAVCCSDDALTCRSVDLSGVSFTSSVLSAVYVSALPRSVVAMGAGDVFVIGVLTRLERELLVSGAGRSTTLFNVFFSGSVVCRCRDELLDVGAIAGRVTSVPTYERTSPRIFRIAPVSRASACSFCSAVAVGLEMLSTYAERASAASFVICILTSSPPGASSVLMSLRMPFGLNAFFRSRSTGAKKELAMSESFS